MKDFYTDETFTYVIDTNNMVWGGNNADCDIPMLGVLPSDVEYFICCPIFFNSSSLVLSHPPSSAIVLEAKDFIETGFSTHNNSSYKAIMPPIYAANTSHATGLLNNISNMHYVVKNFNNKTIRFTMRNVEGFEQDVIANGGYLKHWLLILSLTPIRDKVPRYIKNNYSFTYTITSVNAIGNANDCYITLPTINDNHNSYFVDVINFKINADTIQSGQHRYINLYAYNWAENGYSGYYKYTDRVLVAAPYIKNENNPNFFAGNGSVFKISNMKQQRQIRFKMYYPFLGDEVLPGHIDNGGTTFYSIAFKLTVID